MSSIDPYWRLKELFAEVLEKPPAERESFLQTACADDAETLARVRSLLSVHENAATMRLGSDTTNDKPGEFACERIGELIGPYRLVQQIGEGGFGTVYLAEQDSPVKRRVALKIIKIGMDTRQVIARFEQERQALAAMDHPNIAKVFDAGATSTGRPYFVMELINGETITNYCDKSNLSINQRLELMIQVCHALQHAHQKGLIHRDIKPSNVLVTIHDNQPIVKVIDFGIAKATQARLTEKTFLTEHRQLIGTPEYMSPEQADSHIDIDTRSDLYSLGVLLYELLTGTTPFDARELRSKAYAEIQRVIREIDPPTPSTRLSTLADELTNVAARRSMEPKRLSASIRGELDWIVMKCLEKSRESRYESASALATDLAMHLSDQPISAGKPSRLHHLRKFVRRNRGPVFATATVLLVLIAGIIGTTVGLVRESRQRAIAEQQRQEARDNLIDYLWTKALDTQAEPILREELASAGAANTPRKANMCTMLGEVLCDERRPVNERRPVEGEEMFRRAVAVYRACEPPDDPELSMSLIDLGVVLGNFNRYGEAEAPFREALAMARRTMPADSLLRAEYITHLATALAFTGKDLTEAEVLTREAMAVFQTQPIIPWRVASTQSLMGKILIGERRFPEAEAELVAAEPTGRLNMKWHRDMQTRFVDLYTAWDKAEPGKGYDLKAQQWSAEHDKLNPITSR